MCLFWLVSARCMVGVELATGWLNSEIMSCACWSVSILLGEYVKLKPIASSMNAAMCCGTGWLSPIVVMCREVVGCGACVCCRLVQSGKGSDVVVRLHAARVMMMHMARMGFMGSTPGDE